jgi:hypothetical protein
MIVNPGADAMRAIIKRDPTTVLSRLIDRLELTVPFPIDIRAFHLSLFPEQFIAAVHEHAAYSQNMRAVLTTSHQVTVHLGYDRFIRLSLEYGSLSPKEEFLQCMNHPRQEELVEWHEKATTYNVILTEMQETMAAVLLDSHALGAWPELAHAVGITRLPRSSTAALQRHLEGTQGKAKLDALLAQASLLPDIRAPHAWVGLIGR